MVAVGSKSIPEKQSISIESLIKTTETTFLVNELIQNID